MKVEVTKELPAAHPVAPGVPEGFRLEKLYEPERIKVEKIGGGFCCFCKTGSGGVETAAFEFLNAMLSASPSLATERDAVDAQKVRNDALEEAANLLESGSFLHDDAPDARLAQSAAKAIRSLQSQPASAGKDAEGFYLASFKRKPSSGFVTWWGANNAGYTHYLNQAGIYRKDELEDGYHDSEYTVPVPVSFVRKFEQRVVDCGMTVCGKTFWSAANLRAAIAQKENG